MTERLKRQLNQQLLGSANESGDVAVTACTTGIAHTYVGSRSPSKVAAEMGVGIKVETNGASGVGNKLTAEDTQESESSHHRSRQGIF